MHVVGTYDLTIHRVLLRGGGAIWARALWQKQWINLWLLLMF